MPEAVASQLSRSQRWFLLWRWLCLLVLVVVENHVSGGSHLEEVVLDLVAQLENDCTVKESRVLVSFLQFRKDVVEEAPSKAEIDIL